MSDAIRRNGHSYSRHCHAEHPTKSTFLFVDVVDAEEGTGKGGGFAEGYEEGLMDLALGVNEDAAEEEDEAT